MSVLLLTMGPQLGLVMETPALRVGEPGTIKFHAPGAVGQVKWSVVESDLPAEWGAITPDGADATINTAEALVWGEYTITVRAADTQRVPVARTFSVWVEPDAIVVTGGGPFEWIHNAPVNESLPVSGGTGVYTSVETTGSPLPAGLSVAIVGASVLLSGTPIGVSSGVTQIIVRDSEGAAGQATIVFEVSNPPQILIGGNFTSVAGTTRSRIARLNPDGTLDPMFIVSANSSVLTVVSQQDGKILIGGNFTAGGSMTRPYLARRNADGSADAVFDVLYVNWFVNAIAVQPDGRILIGGIFTNVGERIARLNPDGSIDSGFTASCGGAVEAIALQQDGKVLAGGGFTDAGGSTRNRIARFNSDGTLDTSFDPNCGGTVYAIALQQDGKILIGGQFTSVAGTTRNRIARLNPDGTLDTSFNPNCSSTVEAIALQQDGKILVGGAFSSVAGTARSRIARLNPDGSLDMAFDPNCGSTVRSFALQQDGKILIGGNFTTVSGTTRNRIARLNPDGSLDMAFDPNCGSTVYSIALVIS